jgi:hypothetical protein
VDAFSSNFVADWSLTFATQKLFPSVLRTEDTPPIDVMCLQAVSEMLKDFDV